MKSENYLGRKCRDIVTGITGICISYSECLFGCDTVQLSLNDSTEIEKKTKIYTFLVPRIQIIDSSIIEGCSVPKYTPSSLLGTYCEDKVTGFQGVCTVRIIPLFNCEQYALTEKYNPNMLLPSETTFVVDEGRLKVLESPDETSSLALTPEAVQTSRPGGVSIDPRLLKL